MIKDKHILALDFIVVVVTLVGLIAVVGYVSPLVISPIDDFKTSNNTILFSFDNANRILIDENLEFSSPQIVNVEDDILINLKPGIYYWKVEGLISSEIRKLTIESEIDLKLKKSGEGYDIVNAGNSKLSVDIYDHGRLSGNVVLDVGEEESIEGEKFVGKEVENE